MSIEIKMRAALDDDTLALSQLICKNAQTTLAPHYTEEQWKSFISCYSPQVMREKIVRQTIFCAVSNDEIIGTIALENSFVVGFYTRLENLSQGVGTIMMNHLEIFAKNAGLTEIQLAASPAGLSYYYKNGWTKVKEVIINYKDVPFKETLMSKRLN